MMKAQCQLRLSRTHIKACLVLKTIVLACLWTSFLDTAFSGVRTAEEEQNFQRDREAIRALAGDYHVQFSFRETVSFSKEYRLAAPYEPDGYEIIRVIRDDGALISLQHILVGHDLWDEPGPTKHWRQDWIFEPEQLFEYVGRDTWHIRRLDDSERRGKWAQLIYQVDDSPRYAALAEWTHAEGVSSWTSPPTWRPLPRREVTKRRDYDVLVSSNRHALTPNGWVHEQDNSKLILGDRPRLLVREHGVNTYATSQAFDIQVAERYWKDTHAYWDEVRAVWRDLLSRPGSLNVQRGTESGRLDTRLLTLADDVRHTRLDVQTAIARARDIIRASTTSHAVKFDDQDIDTKRRLE
ncbi:MAG TPA: DUF6607 family protein [Nitrospira sp.]|nr:DUF6607 family protein [Nitrospira sp.]